MEGAERIRGYSTEAGVSRPVTADFGMSRPLTADVCTGWIDVPICEAILSKPVKVIVAVDGFERSMTALTYVTECLMQHDRNSFSEVVHVWDEISKKENLRTIVETKLTTSVSSKRYRLTWIPSDKVSIGEHIGHAIYDLPADYAVLGFSGTRRTRSSTNKVASTLSEVLRQGNCSVIVMKDDSDNLLPKGRQTKFVVSVSLNKASTKAFLDALRLSRPGDEIHVVFVKGYLENAESDYTKELRQKYNNFFSGLKDGGDDVFSKFHDRLTEFAIIPKRKRETTPQAVVRYADDIEADFIVVGTNSMRVERGKTAIGSVSWQICLETDRNFIVSNWVDVNPRVYEAHVRRGMTPGQSRACTPAPGKGSL